MNIARSCAFHPGSIEMQLSCCAVLCPCSLSDGFPGLSAEPFWRKQTWRCGSWTLIIWSIMLPLTKSPRFPHHQRDRSLLLELFSLLLFRTPTSSYGNGIPTLFQPLPSSAKSHCCRAGRGGQQGHHGAFWHQQG